MSAQLHRLTAELEAARRAREREAAEDGLTPAEAFVRKVRAAFVLRVLERGGRIYP